MTIFDYDNLPTISIPYILREVGNPAIGAWVTNQETKEKFFCDAVTLPTSVFYDGYFTIDITDLVANVNVNTTLLVSAIDSNNLPIYRDIVVFSDRLDTESDYEQNDNSGEYAFV
jgi:hypothetical protein